MRDEEQDEDDVGEDKKTETFEGCFYIGDVITVVMWSSSPPYLGSRLASTRKSSVMSFTMSREAPDRLRKTPDVGEWTKAAMAQISDLASCALISRTSLT